MLNKIKALVVTLVVAAGIILVAAAPAQAFAFSCPSPYMCTFDGANGTGFRYDYGDNIGAGCWNNGRKFTTSSAAMRRLGWRVKFYSTVNCSTLLSHFETPWMYNGQDVNFGPMDNQVGSFRFEYCAPCG